MAGFTRRQRDRWYEYLVARDGPFCFITRIPAHQANLVIDHIDNNRQNNSPGNLMLVTRSVNHIKNPRGKKPMPEMHSSVCVSPEATTIDAPRASSLEFLKNQHSEPTFKTWLFREMVHCGRVRYRDALNEGASAADCSQESIKRYLNKELTSNRPYRMDVEEDSGERIIRFKRRFQIIHLKYAERKKLERQARNWRRDSGNVVRRILEGAANDSDELSAESGG